MKKSLFKTLILLVLPILAPPTTAQTQKPTPSATINLHFAYAFQIPAANISQLYGPNSNIAIQAEYLHKSGWFFGLGGDFITGNDLKIDVLRNLRTTQGYILGDDNEITDVTQSERGLYISAYVGKLLRLKETKKSTQGIHLAFGAGFLQHQIN